MQLKPVSCFGFVRVGMAREPTGPSPASQATPFADSRMNSAYRCPGGRQRQLRLKGTGYAKALTAILVNNWFRTGYTSSAAGSNPAPDSALFRAMPVETGLHIGPLVVGNGTISN